MSSVWSAVYMNCCCTVSTVWPSDSSTEYSTVQYNTVQYSTVQCSAVQYSTVQRYSVTLTGNIRDPSELHPRAKGGSAKSDFCPTSMRNGEVAFSKSRGSL